MNTYDFSGKTVVVTGSARGIGRRIGERFYEAGANVAFCSRSPKGKDRLLDEVAGSDHSRVMAGVVDVAHIDQIASFFSEVVKHFGAFDVLVNNAGIWERGNALDATEEQWERVIATDLKSVFFACQWFCRYHKEQGTPGAIVNISSINAARCRPGNAVYNVAKAGVRAVTESFAQDVGEYGIRVNAVGPGSVPTDLNDAVYRQPGTEEAYNATVPLGRRGTKDDIANAVLFLASDDAAYLTGTSIYSEGGWLMH
ncbi:MAG: SDR family NAD(P)-dependent oxidoreductase [Eggerthellaceae bacterium]|jgi:glucose 1-dehydrogenase